jgi:hypothetical protein
VVEQSSWGCDQNVDSGAHRMLLGRHAYPAIDRGRRNRRMDRHRIERRENLRGELSRRSHDQRSRFPARLANEMVENRKQERGGLAASCHGAGENVPPLESGGDCFSLNWCRSLEAQLLETFLKTGIEL